MKDSLDRLLLKYKVQPVGWGYIDCIIIKDYVAGFVESLSDLGIKITYITWWCHCTERSKGEYGCPHGMGGPQSKFFDGFFSEMYDGPFETKVERNEDVTRYIFTEVPKEEWYGPCMVPAFWLDVPDDWRNVVDQTV